MARFSYVAKTRDARTIKEIEDATSHDEIVSRLRGRGLFVISIREVQESGNKIPVLSLFSKGVGGGKRGSLKLDDLALLARNLATTLSSGVTLLRSLEIISVQTESYKLEQILRACSEDIKRGLSLCEAVGKYPDVFSYLWKGIIEVGEASGNLPFVLEKLADYLELRMEFERKIKSAMVYPTILLVAASIAMFVFFKFILPKFTELFTQFNLELPTPTKIVFGMSQFVEKNTLLIVVALAGFIGLMTYGLKQPGVRKTWDKIVFKVPIMGKIAMLVAVERFTSTMYILLDSGLPLVYTLEVSARATGNIIMENSILAVKEKVREGGSLSEEFKRTRLFPLMISEMTKIGEETGSLPEVFKKVAAHYQKNLSTSVERMITAFEPLMILFMGVMIGGIVVSLFLPLFKLATVGG